MNELSGKPHPLLELRSQALQSFIDMGFQPATGPEMETQWYNFDALNVPKDHPARDMQDTFFIKGDEENVLRTHTTSVTARSLEIAAKAGEMTHAAISIGKVFRNESTDSTHEMQFFQIDGAMVGPDINLANLKGILLKFYRDMLGDDVEITFLPSFFPFTEPSVEIFVQFRGKLLEVMGGGMLHPNVIKNVGYDPEKVQGFAFGGGLDRIAMVKWNVSDIRYLYQGDLRLQEGLLDSRG